VTSEFGASGGQGKTTSTPFEKRQPKRFLDRLDVGTCRGLAHMVLLHGMREVLKLRDSYECTKMSEVEHRNQ
jgi:hypothetical protein